MCVFSWLNISLRNSLVVSQVPVLMPMDLMVEASPRRIFANAHTYHINSISVNSDYETYISADDLRINLWHLEITDRSFSILHTISDIHCFALILLKCIVPSRCEFVLILLCECFCIHAYIVYIYICTYISSSHSLIYIAILHF